MVSAEYARRRERIALQRPVPIAGGGHPVGAVHRQTGQHDYSGAVRAFPDPEATPEEIYPYIKSISYPNNKAKNLAGMARMLVSEFGGEVPSDLDQLQRLPGVGRKTANVIGIVVFNEAVMPVDTHVFRVSDRLGLTTGAKTPLQTEHQLTAHIPPELLPIAHHWLILHGRYVCQARRPKCDQCGLTPWCRYYGRKEK